MRTIWFGRFAPTMCGGVLLLAGGLLLAGCPGDDDDDASSGDDDVTADDDDTTGDDDIDVPELRGPCELAGKVGYFHVAHELDYSSVSGEVSDGTVPVTVLEQVASEGPCRLMRRNNPFCDPPCEPGTTCDFDGSCIPYPMPYSVGTVTVEGLAAAVSMDYPAYFDTSLPHPPFADGAGVRLTAAGDEYAGFTLYGVGVAPIATDDEVWIVREGEALDVSWVPADTAKVQVQLRFNIDQHGNSPVELLCDLDDTGSHAVPSVLVEQLLVYGVSGFASGNLTRRSVDSVDAEFGCVEFVVFSHLQGNLQVEGHIPCDDPDDCPEGMECDFATNTCV